MLHRFLADDGVSGKLAYPLKTALASDLPKFCNNSASYVAGGPFMSGSHYDIK